MGLKYLIRVVDPGEAVNGNALDLNSWDATSYSICMNERFDLSRVVVGGGENIFVTEISRLWVQWYYILVRNLRMTLQEAKAEIKMVEWCNPRKREGAMLLLIVSSEIVRVLSLDGGWFSDLWRG